MNFSWTRPAMGHLLVDTMTPMTMELTLTVQAELEARLEETDRVRQQLERAHYEVEHERAAESRHVRRVTDVTLTKGDEQITMGSVFAAG